MLPVKWRATAERCHLRIPAARRQFETLILPSATRVFRLFDPLVDHDGFAVRCQ